MSRYLRACLALLPFAGALFPVFLPEEPRRAEAQITGIMDRQQALQIFLANQDPFDPDSANSAAFFYNLDSPDSVLMPGQMLQSWDGTFQFRVVNPTYFFWTDHGTHEFWTHRSNFTLVDGTYGFVFSQDAESWPVIDGQEVDRFLIDGNNSPELILGGGYPEGGVIFDANPEPQPVDNRWGLIIAGKNLHGEEDETAIKGDANRAFNLINGVPRGPKVDKDNIRTVGINANSTGASVDSICKFIDNFPKGCGTIYFYYVGHGKPGAMIVGEGNNKEELKYSELVKKLEGLGAEQVRVVIMACFSGSAVKEFKKSKLKGLVATSSSGGQETDRIPDGSEFLKAVYTCAFDINGDLNRDGKQEEFENLTWAVAQNPTVEGRNPQGCILGDGRAVTVGISKPRELELDRKINCGRKDYVFEIVNVALKVRGKPPTYIGRIYINNLKNSTNNAARYPIIIRCYDIKRQLVDTIKLSVRDQYTPAGTRVCVAKTVPNCVTFDVVRDTGSEGAGILDVAAVLPDGLLAGDRTRAYDPCEPVFQEFPFAGAPLDSFTATVDTLAGWGLGPIPAGQRMPLIGDSTFAVVEGVAPDTATVGGRVCLTVTNETTGDTLRSEFHALVRDSLTTAISGGDLRRHAFLETAAGMAAGSGTVDLRECLVNVIGPSTLSVSPGASLVMHNVTAFPESAATYTFSVSGALDWDYGSLIGADQGLELTGTSGTLYGGASVQSLGDGLRCGGDLSGLDFSFFVVDSAAANGAMFDGATGALLRNLTIENSGAMDVVLVNNSGVELRNSVYDSGKESVEAGSILTRSWDTWFFPRTASGDSIPGVGVLVVDALGDTIAHSYSDTSGFVELPTLIQYVNDGGAVTAHTPHLVTLSVAGFDTTFAHVADSSGTFEVELPASVTTGTGDDPRNPPAFLLSANSPNPFGAATSVRYQVPRRGAVQLLVFDVRGRVVEALVNEDLDPGEYEATWTPSAGVASGVYFLRLNIAGQAATRKLLLVR